MKLLRSGSEQTRNDDMRILGCHILKDFIYSQTDRTYMHNLNGLLPKVCGLARENGEHDSHRRLRASSLEALAAMVLTFYL